MCKTPEEVPAIVYRIEDNSFEKVYIAKTVVDKAKEIIDKNNDYPSLTNVPASSVMYYTSMSVLCAVQLSETVDKKDRFAEGSKWQAKDVLAKFDHGLQKYTFKKAPEELVKKGMDLMVKKDGNVAVITLDLAKEKFVKGYISEEIINKVYRLNRYFHFTPNPCPHNRKYCRSGNCPTFYYFGCEDMTFSPTMVNTVRSIIYACALAKAVDPDDKIPDTAKEDMKELVWQLYDKWDCKKTEESKNIDKIMNQFYWRSELD